MKIDEIRQGLNTLRDTMSDGWERLRHSAVGALTHFKPGQATEMPARTEVDDAFYLPSHGWSLLGGDLFEDESRLVVRIEAPGMDKGDFSVQVQGDMLVVSGEKHFERESTEGRWRVLQCAYGAFHRTVPLPLAVRSEEARATYRNGVLKIELPKAAPAKPRTVTVAVEVG